MNLHFTGRNIDVTPALKTFTSEKMEKLKHRHDAIDKIDIVFHVENVTHIAEATLKCEGQVFHATAESEDMYVAIDVLVDKLLKQITKHKEKMKDKH
jgi:putative sigma-54 modulation protein